MLSKLSKIVNEIQSSWSSIKIIICKDRSRLWLKHSSLSEIQPDKPRERLYSPNLKIEESQSPPNKAKNVNPWEATAKLKSLKLTERVAAKWVYGSRVLSEKRPKGIWGLLQVSTNQFNIANVLRLRITLHLVKKERLLQCFSKQRTTWADYKQTKRT